MRVIKNSVIPLFCIQSRHKIVSTKIYNFKSLKKIKWDFLIRGGGGVSHDFMRRQILNPFCLIRNLQYNTYRPCHLISGDHTAVQWGTITYNRMCDYEPRFETCKLMKSLATTTSLFSFYQSGSVESLDLCFKRESKASIYVTVTRNLHQVIPNCSVSKQKQHSKTLYWFIIKI